ncbi:DNA polymerase I [Alphaproteobacteria bacterium]|nr:DNA polymerase I [Alphaproteobacteria bacterium]
MSESRLILVDGSGYIFRAYYALPPMNNSKGIPTNAVYGFCNMMLRLIEEHPSDKILIILDAGKNTFRNTLFPDYKANRGEAPEDLIPQFSIIREAIEAFGLDVIEKKDFEADDVIASYVKYGEDNKIPTTVFSSDKDLFQLLSANNRIMDPMKNVEIDEAKVMEKFGVGPDRITDVQALIGDSVDNIPGVPGIGPKTAAKLINEFGTFEELLLKKDQISNVRIKNLIHDHEESAKISHKLVILKNDLELPIKIEKLKKFDDSTKLNDFFKKYEFKSLIRTSANETKPHASKKNIDFKSLTKTKEIIEYLNSLKSEKILAVDLETDSLDVNTANIIGVSLSNADQAYYLPFKSPENELSKKDQESVLKNLRELCGDESILKLFHNAKYDSVILKRFGVNTVSFQDTLLMSFFVNNGLTKHNLEDLYYYYFGEEKEKFKDVIKNESKRKYKDFSEVPLEVATNYAAHDAYATFKLYETLNEQIAESLDSWIYYDIDKKLSLVLQEVESTGCKIDLKFLNKLEKDLNKEIDKIEQKIFKIAGEEFNIGSPKQLTEIFKKLDIKVTKKTKAGDFQTNVKVLEQLESEDVEIASYILQWRQYSKLVSTYTSSLADHADKKDRVHSTFNIAATITGRLSSSEPNLQNIPIRTEIGKKIRTAFIAEKDHELYSFDYSQIELRVLCEACEDPNLLKAFQEDQDIHESTGQLVFNKKIINDNDRRMAKIINFGIIYGISQYGLAKQLGVSNAEAKLFIDNYFKKFPNINDFMKATTDKAKKLGYVENLFGRKSHIKDINAKNFMLRSFAERQAINAPIQGTASELIKIAMLDIHNYLEKNKCKSKMTSQVHDELLFEIYKKEKDIIPEIAKLMETSHQKYKSFKTPIKVDFGGGLNWGEAH